MALLRELRRDDGSSLVEAYEAWLRGYESSDWRDGRGRGSVGGYSVEDLWFGYKDLWREYFRGRPELLVEIDKISKSYILTDIHSESEASQARAIAEILNERRGLCYVGSIREAVISYISWVLNGDDDRAVWVRDRIRGGELRGRPILYYKELGEPSHANALDYLINRHDWGGGGDSLSIYKSLPSRTESGNVIIRNVIGRQGLAVSDRLGAVYALRVKGERYHFGNPYTHRGDLVGEFIVKHSRVYVSNGYELSEVGDRRYSSLSARLGDGRTIEEAYQLDLKGYRRYPSESKREEYLVGLVRGWVERYGMESLRCKVGGIQLGQVDGISEERILNGVGFRMGTGLKVRHTEEHVVIRDALRSQYRVMSEGEYNRDYGGRKVRKDLHFIGTREECLRYIEGLILMNRKDKEMQEMGRALCERVERRRDLRNRVTFPLPSEVRSGGYLKSCEEFKRISEELGLVGYVGEKLVEVVKHRGVGM